MIFALDDASESNSVSLKSDEDSSGSDFESESFNSQSHEATPIVNKTR